MSTLYCPDGWRLTDTFPFVHDGVCHAFTGLARADMPWDFGAKYMAIGHLVSRDLVHWQQHPNALEPAGGNLFDGVAVNVGCIFEHEKKFYMFYWSRCSTPFTSFIGLAVSDDLEHWRRVSDRPTLTPDPHWYETEVIRDGLGGVYSCGVRDPFVFHNPADGKFHMIFAARTRSGPLSGRGCIGHAVSDDLLHWQAGEPLLAPGLYSEMEVPQLFQLADRWFLHFYCMVLWLSDEGKRQIPPHEQISSHYYWTAGAPVGQFERLTEHVFIGNDPKPCCPLVRREFNDFQGQPSVIHFNYAKAGADDAEEDAGWLALPKTLRVTPEGLLRCGVHPTVRRQMGPAIFDKTFAGSERQNGIGPRRPVNFIAEMQFTLAPNGRCGLRLTREASEKIYDLAVCDSPSGIELIHARDNKLLGRRPLAEPLAGDHTLTVVACDEFFDVFLDDRWFLTTAAYQREHMHIGWFTEGVDSAIKQAAIHPLIL